MACDHIWFVDFDNVLLNDENLLAADGTDRFAKPAMQIFLPRWDLVTFCMPHSIDLCLKTGKYDLVVHAYLH